MKTKQDQLSRTVDNVDRAPYMVAPYAIYSVLMLINHYDFYMESDTNMVFTCIQPGYVTYTSTKTGPFFCVFFISCSKNWLYFSVRVLDPRFNSSLRFN